MKTIFLFLFLFFPLSAMSVYRLEEVLPGKNFEMPVDLKNAGDGSNRIFVVEKKGRIYSLIPGFPGTLNQVLDISDQVSVEGMEEGLLGLAFAPDFKNSKLFYIYYSAKGPRRTVLSRINFDSKKQDMLLEISQPYSNHKGGSLQFGPDGYLYLGLGDGGSGGDPHGNGQNLKVLLGKILRVDVSKGEEGHKYAIPSDNPFYKNDKGYREEIFAYGLRNPWRFSFDKKTGELWAADVGQDRFEEIDIIVKGKNYGWNIMEGLHCFKPENDCPQEGLELPIYEYGRKDGRSVIGGYVYRGSKTKDLIGKYIFGDFVSGKIWALKAGGKARLLLDSKKSISSFGVDETGEIYICDFNGKIFHLL